VRTWEKESSKKFSISRYSDTLCVPFLTLLTLAKKWGEIYPLVWL